MRFGTAVANDDILVTDVDFDMEMLCDESQFLTEQTTLVGS